MNELTTFSILAFSTLFTLINPIGLTAVYLSLVENFKDEESLEEWNLEFPNENMEELKELYLAICEMEYFPMECDMIGYKRKDVLENQTTLIVSKFNILYIQGCGEE